MDMAQQAGLSSKQQHLSQCGDSKWGTHPITFGPICLCFSHVYPERFHRWTQVYIRPLGSFSDGISMGEAGIFSDAWLNQQNISNERSQVRFQLYLDLQRSTYQCLANRLFAVWSYQKSSGAALHGDSTGCHGCSGVCWRDSVPTCWWRTLRSGIAKSWREPLRGNATWPKGLH